MIVFVNLDFVNFAKPTHFRHLPGDERKDLLVQQVLGILLLPASGAETGRENYPLPLDELGERSFSPPVEGMDTDVFLVLAFQCQRSGILLGSKSQREVIVAQLCLQEREDHRSLFDQNQNGKYLVIMFGRWFVLLPSAY